MSGYWTTQHPGRGDAGAAEEAALALRTIAAEVEGSAAQVTGASETLAASWTGESADAWVDRAHRSAEATRALVAPLREAATALESYGATVRDIAARSAVVEADLAAARTALVAAQGAVPDYGPYVALAENLAADLDPWTSPARVAARRVDAAESEVADQRRRLDWLVEERRSADEVAAAQLQRLMPPLWHEAAALVGVLSLGALSGGRGWRADFSRWATGLPEGDAGAAALRWALADLTDDQVTELLEDDPALAALLMHPADLTNDAQFGGVAQAVAAGSGVAAVAAAFSRMSSADQRTLARLHPWLVGNLDGAPYSARIAANRTAITAALVQDSDAIERAEARIAELEAQLPTAWSPGTRGYPDPAVMRALADARAELADLTANVARYDLLLTERTTVYQAGARESMSGHQVVLFDPEGGRFAEIVGTIGPNTTNVGILVGGTGTNVTTMSAEYKRALSFVTGTAEQGELAVISYLGGPMPQEILPEAADPAYARDLGPGLRDFAAGVDRPGGAALTVMGHSYGGSVVGAAEASGMVVDRVVHVASAGAGPGVASAADYAAPNASRYSMTAPGDFIELVQGIGGGGRIHGADPDTLDGVVRLETGRSVHDKRHSPLLEGFDSHSAVFTPGSTSWLNMLNVLTGEDVMLHTAPDFHVYSSGTSNHVVTEYPMEDPTFEPPTAQVP